MKCPNCGADMADGSLYCELCGEDIHIVPDYEPELEFNLSQTLNSIMEDVNGEDSGEEDSGSDKVSDEETDIGTDVSPHRRTAVIICIVCAAVLLLAGGICGVFVYQYNSYDYQLDKAGVYLSGQKHELAIKCYKRALELNDKDVEVSFSLAEAYLQKGNKIEYEYLMREIIRSPASSQEQLERAYGKLIAIYKDRGEYDTINQILQASDNDKIKTSYQNYLVNPPEFNYEGGYYDQLIPLKLTACAAGRIYYTMDGSEPDENSLLYTAPVMLENGDHLIKAYFVNEYGVASDVVTKEYHIFMVMESAPQISVISGDYSVPMMIEVMDEYLEDVYYTTDGTDPNLHSAQYTAPIPMPLGKSRFRFAHIKDDGTLGDVADRTYRLTLNTQLSEKDAEAVIVECMLCTGKIYNERGDFSTESAAQYKYVYQYVMNINQTDDFYVIAEIYRDEDGVQAKTGSYFAVNCYTGEYYKLQTDENNNYSLVEILIDSQEEG